LSQSDFHFTQLSLTHPKSGWLLIESEACRLLRTNPFLRTNSGLDDLYSEPTDHF